MTYQSNPLKLWAYFYLDTSFSGVLLWYYKFTLQTTAICGEFEELRMGRANQNGDVHECWQDSIFSFIRRQSTNMSFVFLSSLPQAAFQRMRVPRGKLKVGCVVWITGVLVESISLPVCCQTTVKIIYVPTHPFLPFLDVYLLPIHVSVDCYYGVWVEIIIYLSWGLSL